MDFYLFRNTYCEIKLGNRGPENPIDFFRQSIDRNMGDSQMSVPTHNSPLRMIAVLLAGLCLSFLNCHASAAGDRTPSYTHLLEALMSGNLDLPRYAFGDFENSFDPKIHATNLEYLTTHPELLERIRSNLGAREFRWRLKSLSHRLLYATETRMEFVARFESYCKEVIGEVLGELELPNPYTHIVTLTSEAPSFETADGFNAYIVRDLAKEYRAAYEFSNISDEKIVIELTGQYASGEVGAFTSSLEIDEEGKLHFIHDTYTIWQNSAKNPYTVLMTPVEETLHILLRESTEAAIRRSVEAIDGCSPREAKKIVDEWISVEEAIVGGLVYHLLPPILERKIGPLPEHLISSDLESKEQFLKYNKLGQGIRLVLTRGTRACLELYLKNPEAVRDLLT